MKKQIVKNILCVVLCAALLLPASLPAAFAEGADGFTEVSSGDWTYRAYDDGRTLLYRYIGSSENVTVPAEIDGRTVDGLVNVPGGDESVMGGNSAVESITFELQAQYIPRRFAKGCTNLTSVTLPRSVTVIRNAAFYGCAKLQTIGWPAALTEIGIEAFRNCTALQSIDLPASVTTINNYAFAGCTALTTVKLPSGLSEIHESVFYNCTALKAIKVPDSVEEIGASAFMDCTNLQSVDLPRELTVISRSLFFGCASLETIDIPSSVHDIQDMAFRNCKMLRDVTLPSRLYNLRSEAFRGCSSLKSIYIPGTVTNVGAYAFYECTALETAVLGFGVRTIGKSDTATGNAVSDGYTFKADQKLTVTLPATVNTVYEASFDDVPGKYFDGTKNQFESVEFKEATDKQNFRYRVSVSFQSDYGTTPETLHPYLGETITLPRPVTKGFSFVGWKQGDTLYADTYTPQSDAVTLKAQWIAHSNMINFITDKGTTPETQFVWSGNTVSDPGGQLVEGEYLAGWYKTPDCSGDPYDFSEPVFEYITLYAKWEPAPLVEVNVIGAGALILITFRDKRDDTVYAAFTQSGSAVVPGDAKMVVTTADSVICSGVITSEIQPDGDGSVYLKTQDIVNDTRVYTPQYGIHAQVNVTFSATPVVTVNAAADGGIGTSSLWTLKDGYNNTYTTGSRVTLPSGMTVPDQMNLTLTLTVPDGYGCDGTILNGDSTIAVADGMTSIRFLPEGSVTVNLHFYKRDTYRTLTFRDKNSVTGVYFTQKYRTDSQTSFTVPECPYTSTSGVFTVWKQEGANMTITPGDTLPMPDEDTTYVATWKPARFISFNRNNGTGAMAKLAALEEDAYTATVPENGFARDGYAFTGWNTRSNGRGTAYAPGDPVTLTANITLYAQWTSAYTVFLDPNGAAGDAVRQEIARGASAAIPVVPFTRYGGVLTGWNTAADGSGTAYAPGATVTPTADMTLYAQWRADAQALDSYDLLSIDELPNGGRLHAGHTYRLTASYPELGLPADVTWRSLDPSVLTVDENGTVTAVSNGWACVMAVDETGKASQVELTVFLNDPNVRVSGDVDMNGEVSTADIVLITRSLAGGWNVRIWESQADVNADGIIDLKDVVLIRRYLAEGWNVTLV